ncbi:MULTISPECIES: ABC transporter ATP-binding protein [unclassified Phenylobacterium]|uniref:ABC transporter ATP-binding protein n=1 Tax=unclassified Phenylobacterium TaxID=2640670 RepID=UPI0022B3E8A5|nr:ABC transporter ATP-binding protein [Phenylobacterium sp. NIBR 498073]WGU38911.1 ABC transporter ATP-binding protein [Phenylobacterium sp. NIBR 498073]
MTERSRPRLNIGAVRSTFAPWADPTAKPLVRFEKVVKRFDGETAVNGVSLDIYPGEFFALLGPSGCGKTTLMRLLAGFETPDEGRVLLAGEDLAGKRPHERPVNMMFQSYALFPHLSVEKNIAFGLKQQGMPKDEIAARVAEMLSLVRLDGLARRKPHQLSGGQRQRVALARAIAPRPKMLLLDEPLAALDKKLREETQWELMALQQQLGMTFLIVTHDQEEAMVTADRIAVMRAGQIVQMGRPADVYEAPNSRYVADFIGDVNIFEGVAEHADGLTVRMASSDSPQGFDIVEDDRIPVGSTAWLAVRPEKIQVHLDEPPPGPNRMGGKVADIGYLGDWTTYLVELDSGRMIRAARANATRFVDRPVDWDDQVWLTFARDAGVVLTQ